MYSLFTHVVAIYCIIGILLSIVQWQIVTLIKNIYVCMCMDFYFYIGFNPDKIRESFTFYLNLRIKGK